MTFARLRAMAPPRYLTTPQRPAFHLLLLATRGSAPHTVDFASHRLAPERSVWVRPGQVQVFGLADGDGLPPAGDLVLFRPDFLIPGTRAAAIADDPFGPTALDHPVEARARIDRARRELRREYARAAAADRVTATQTETLRHLLSVLVLRLGAGPAAEAGDERDGLYERFRSLLEGDFAGAHDVGHYADALGYSTRTLARATRTAAGRTPKQAIQDRIALEARRLLAHTDLPSSTIATRLGFQDPSNFSSFFARHTGDTPTAFRARERGPT